MEVYWPRGFMHNTEGASRLPRTIDPFLPYTMYRYLERYDTIASTIRGIYVLFTLLYSRNAARHRRCIRARITRSFISSIYMYIWCFSIFFSHPFCIPQTLLPFHFRHVVFHRVADSKNAFSSARKREKHKVVPCTLHWGFTRLSSLTLRVVNSYGEYLQSYMRCLTL